MGKTIVIVGGQFGDEGKGKIVDFLTEKADLVARFNGGNNAGHTVVIKDDVFKFHLIPSGIIHKDKLNIMGNGMVIDPKDIVGEIEGLEEKGYNISDKNLAISGNAHVILEKHIEEDKATGGKIGTTSRGIGPCYKDKIARTGLRMIDYVKEDNKYARKLKPLVKDTSLMINRYLDDKKNILLEGAQGTLLDIDHGTYPFVTSSNVIAGGACTGLGIGPTKINKVIAIMKAYITRVGSGVLITELGKEEQTKNEDSIDELKKTLGEEGLSYLKRKIHNKSNEGDEYNQGRLLRFNGMEYGTTTGRPRRCGWFDVLIAKYAARVNGLNAVVMTKLDVLDDFKKIKLCVAYEYKGTRLTEFTNNVKILEQCRPIYETMEGWCKDITKVKEFKELPKNAQKYIERIEELTKIPVCIISVGPERNQTIILRKEDLF
ncbi:adenylosuccinate synthetase [Candidatus Woesearchaeota archaeon]|nr:adenylosuccinate synthetase [Candidatus Woesearchaeota archaeon]